MPFSRHWLPHRYVEHWLGNAARTGAAARRRQLAHHPDRFSVILQELIKQAEAFLKSASQQPGYGIMVLKARRCHTAAAAASGRLPTAPSSSCWGRSLTNPCFGKLTWRRIGCCFSCRWLCQLPGSCRMLQQHAPSPPTLQLITLDSVAVEVRQAAAINFKNFVKYHWVPRESDGLGAAPTAIPDAEKARQRGRVAAAAAGNQAASCEGCGEEWAARARELPPAHAAATVPTVRLPAGCPAAASRPAAQPATLRRPRVLCRTRSRPTSPT